MTSINCFRVKLILTQITRQLLYDTIVNGCNNLWDGTQYAKRKFKSNVENQKNYSSEKGKNQSEKLHQLELKLEFCFKIVYSKINWSNLSFD